MSRATSLVVLLLCACHGPTSSTGSPPLAACSPPDEALHGYVVARPDDFVISTSAGEYLVATEAELDLRLGERAMAGDQRLPWLVVGHHVPDDVVRTTAARLTEARFTDVRPCASSDRVRVTEDGRVHVPQTIPVLRGNFGASSGRDLPLGRLDAVRSPGQIRTGQPVITGALSAEVVRRVLRRHVGELRACYETLLGERADAAGRVELGWVISSEGAVESTRVVTSSLGSASAEECLMTSLRGWLFPAPADGRPVDVTYPIILAPAPEATAAQAVE